MEPTTNDQPVSTPAPNPPIACGCCGSTVGYMIPNPPTGVVCQDARACLARAGDSVR